jgi:inner membrane protein
MNPITHFMVGWAGLERLQPSMRDKGLVAVHLHFLCDVLGSRGATAEDIWGIYYFAPFSLAHEIAWKGQWELVSWQNTAVSAALLLVIMVRAAARGYSPVGLVSKRADAVFVATLRDWKRRLKLMNGAK